MHKDYYETLQVHPRADAIAIEAAYARLREIYDPARLDGAADELVALAREKRDAVERAYAVLSDPARRATYDAEQAALQADHRPPTTDRRGQGAIEQEAVGRRSSVVGGQKKEDQLDYRPLPPARRQERPRGFEAQPLPARLERGRAPARGSIRRWSAPAIAIGALALIVAASFA